MGRSNYDKPFYVDVGTSIVAIRCASNHDVIIRYDYVWCVDDEHSYRSNPAKVFQRLTKEN